MKKTFTLLLLVTLGISTLFAQPKAKNYIQGITPYILITTTSITPDSNCTSGNNIVNKGYFVYMRAQNFGDSTTINNASWTLLSKPAGSNAVITNVTGLSWAAKFMADSAGTYTIKLSILTASGTADTTSSFYCASYVGTGGFAGVPAQYPNCMSCHASMPVFLDIFNRWKASPHANWFRYNIDSGSASYGTNCFPCHTTGYKHNRNTSDNGFDEVAAKLGWNWNSYSPPKPGNWDSLKIRFPSLVAFASIGCENCHGPGSEHAAGNGDTNKIAVSYDAYVCGQCHDSPQNQPIFRQWINSGSTGHSNAVWSSSFAQQNNGTNNLDNCIRCHDARGYVNFTKGRGTNTNIINQAWHNVITCQTCHDQHGNSNQYNLRNRPTGSDTLATGYYYSFGNGQICADCHKARKNNVTYVQTRVTSSTWGPHHSTQADVLLAKNAATFNGIPYISGSHYSVISNGCVGCHMSQSSINLAEKNKVGGHSWKMRDDSLNYDFTEPCQGCHPGYTRFSDWMSPEDFDGNGIIEDWQTEIKGCIHNLAIALPHYSGTDSVNWSLIAADSNNVILRKAYWNYMLIKNDKSNGMHNPFFAMNVLLASMPNFFIEINHQWSEIPKTFVLTQNFPNPFNPTTKFTFSLPKSQQVIIKVYDIMGREVKTLVDSKVSVDKYTVSWDGTNNMGQQISSGVYFYRMVTKGFTDVKKMVLVK